MADKIEVLPPRVKEKLQKKPEGEKFLRGMQQKNGGLVDTLGGGAKTVKETLAKLRPQKKP
jgi:hypothetical protein